MAKGLLFLLAIIHYCNCFNISALQNSNEKITSLLEEEAKKGKHTGYNVARIKTSNEVIMQLMAKGTKKEHGEEILKLICEYTVGMNENTLDILMLNDIARMFSVYEEIYEFGKPPFIDTGYDIESMKARLSWGDGPVHYFNYVIKDALKAWEYFADQFSLLKKQLKPY